ncbi:hypothetical protein HYY73_02935 [Candidatus Woesearchaeota archaeon]|nr:hypothetical protein [Candidatus Woesearchaeota archaeon]
MAIGNELEIGVSSVFGKCEGDLESAIRSLFPQADVSRFEFDNGLVTYSFTGEVHNNGKGSSREGYKATVIDYRNTEACKQIKDLPDGFDVGITVTGTSSRLQTAVIGKIVSRVPIQVVTCSLSGPNYYPLLYKLLPPSFPDNAQGGAQKSSLN